MGQKDMAEKLLADYNDVFADIVNVLLFDGRNEISEDDLIETKVKSQYKADDSKLHEQERDVAKILKKDNQRPFHQPVRILKIFHQILMITHMREPGTDNDRQHINTCHKA